jgi:TetR/AcrR family transcriptional repressor of nem operon
MRYKPEHKKETHDRIVGIAAREFRENGFDGVGIAALMKKLKLTHGGFYAHFEGKEDLVREALTVSFDEADEQIEDAYQSSGVAGVIDLYLSPEHVANPGFGCPVPALAPEIGRHSGELATLFASRLQHRIEVLAANVPGETASERLDLATFIFCSMTGAVATARAVDDAEQRNGILKSVRRRLLNIAGCGPS